MVLAHLEPLISRPVLRPVSRGPALDRAPAEVIPIRPRRTRAQLVALDDAGLLAEVLVGAAGAFDVFFLRFRGLILSCALKTALGQGRRLPEAELMDVLGEVSLALVANDYRRLRQYRADRGTSVATWVGLIATSTTRDALRKVRRARLELTDGLELERLPSAGPGPEDAFVDAEARRAVDRLLADFSARDREFVMLYFAEALEPERVAQEMGVSVATVYSKKAKIKARLQASAAALA